MRSSQKSNRNRNKNRPKSLGNVANRVFESAGPEGKVRGTPQQIIDKYEQLARDAQTSGDRVVAENFLQHAEHYARLLSAAQAEQQAQQQAQQPQQQQGQPGGGGQPNGAGPKPEGRREDAGGDGGRGGGLETIDTAEDRDSAPLVATPESGGDTPPGAGAQAGEQPGQNPGEGEGAASKPSRSARRRRGQRRKSDDGQTDGEGGDGARAEGGDAGNGDAPARGETTPSEAASG